jgi:hypothetical protein
MSFCPSGHSVKEPSGRGANGHDVPTEPKRRLVAQVSAEVVRRLKILAVEREKPASALVEEAIKQYLERQPVVRPKEPRKGPAAS